MDSNQPIRDIRPFEVEPKRKPRSLRKSLARLLKKRKVRITKQAFNSLLQAARHTPSEIVGDTDSLLLGLLYSGSYTVDVLENASANPYILRALAKKSVVTSETHRFDPVATLLDSDFLQEIIASNRRLETADILRQAISPSQRYFDYSTDFPSDLVANNAPTAGFQLELFNGVCELLAYLASWIYPEFEDNRILRELRGRVAPVSPREDAILDHYLGRYHKSMTMDEFKFCLTALNGWFNNRVVVTDPPDLCLATINRCAPLFFGPGVFADAGGNLKAVDFSLDMASKFAPERDQPTMALFLQNGRIRLGQYSYRNTFVADSGLKVGNPYSAFSMQAIRPTSLLSQQIVSEFESLISMPGVKENELQNFLEYHPEFLEAMGYIRAYPHIILRENGKKDLIPDFLLELPGGRGFDILDLKLPRAKITALNPYKRLSGEVSKAVAQLHAYKAYFDKIDNRKQFEQQFGMVPFKPEAIVVIGRSTQISSRDDRILVNELLGNTKLLTFDDLLEYGNTRSIVIP